MTVGSYQPSEDVRRIQRLLETVDRKTQECAAAEAEAASAQIERDREKKLLDEAHEKKCQVLEEEHTRRHVELRAAHESAEGELFKRCYAKEQAAKKARETLEQARIQLQVELDKMGWTSETPIPGTP